MLVIPFTFDVITFPDDEMVFPVMMLDVAEIPFTVLVSTLPVAD